MFHEEYVAEERTCHVSVSVREGARQNRALNTALNVGCARGSVTGTLLALFLHGQGGFTLTGMPEVSAIQVPPHDCRLLAVISQKHLSLCSAVVVCGL